MKSVFNILVVGAGQIGSRHLQALKKIDFPIFIEIVDPTKQAWEICRERLSEIPENPNIKGISFFTQISQTSIDIDLCIIATNSNVRSVVTEELVSQKKIRYILFEKVLFQSLNEYKTISKILIDNNIEAWVNCSKRMFESYQYIKESLKKEEMISVMIDGNNWGLACNSIHYIDLVTYLTNDNIITETSNFLKNVLIPSKRPGFYEITGSLRFIYSNESELLLRCGSGNQFSLIINIHSDNYHFCIDEDRNYISMSSAFNNWKWEPLILNQSYQSNLTQKIAKSILIDHDCTLPSFELSKMHHIELINAIQPTFKKVLGDHVSRIAIT